MIYHSNLTYFKVLTYHGSFKSYNYINSFYKFNLSPSNLCEGSLVGIQDKQNLILCKVSHGEIGF